MTEERTPGPDDDDELVELISMQGEMNAELLVAPVYYGFSRTRLVYLPEGLWRDFWTGELLQGGRTVRRRAGIEEIPVFARAGAIIPRLDLSPDTLIPATVKGVRVARQ